MNKNKVTLLNIITSVILQIVTILSGFIIPKIILNYFGSNVNGLVSSLNQFLNYICLLEGGITSVIAANLYKPLSVKDNKKISSILKTSQNFYNKIGLIFIVYSIILGIVYPIFKETSFSNIYIFLLTIILAMNLFIQYMFSLSLKTILNADKKSYIVSISQTIFIILNITLGIISVKIYPSIHLLKLITGILYIIQPMVYKHFINKYYIIDKSVSIDNNLIKNRWDGFMINIAYFIHTSTDITILTVLTNNLAFVSIYSIYSLVTNGLKALCNSVFSSINPTIGHAYIKNDKKLLNKKFDMYELITFILVFLFFATAALLITPFVLLYTKNNLDANYNQPILGVLLVLAEAIYLIKTPHLNLSYSANKFKEITPHCFIEAFINIIVSLILVKKAGMIGVAIGTICAMIYRMIYQVNYTSKLIDRYQFLFYKKLIIFTLVTFLDILLCILFIQKTDITIMCWIRNAILYFVTFASSYIIVSILFFKREFNYIKEYLIKK